MNYTVTDIFPIPIYKGKVSVTDQEMEYINIQEKRNSPYLNRPSNNNYILNSVELSSIREQCQKHFDTYATEVLGVKDCRLSITQSWINYNPTGSSHHTHYHQNSIASSVVYLTENPTDIVLFKQIDPHMLAPSLGKITPYNSGMYAVEIEKDDIIIFPSYMAHGVKINENQQERRSLAINTFYSGTLGDQVSLTYLEINQCAQ